MRSLHAIIFVFTIGALFGGLIASITPPANNEYNALRLTPNKDKNNYTFINPLLACNAPEKKDSSELESLKIIVQKIINQKKASGAITNASIYFRDPITGRWAGINSNEKFIPASLLKVPLMIAYFKLAETKPDILSRQILYQNKNNNNELENINPSHAIKPGTAYAVSELIRSMIVDSDNNAVQLLVNNINEDYVHEVFSDIGIPFTSLNDIYYGITAKEYSMFFRILYNATYLNRDMSEQALGLLSKATFKDGLAAGIPDKTLIVHKFGERSLPQNISIIKELHDCGIIYAPKHPYLLCVMTQGPTFAELQNTIKDISAAVYHNFVR